MKHSALSRALFNLFAWTIVVVVSFPLIWMIVTSLKPQTELFRIPPSLLPEHDHLRALCASSCSRRRS